MATVTSAPMSPAPVATQSFSRFPALQCMNTQSVVVLFGQTYPCDPSCWYKQYFNGILPTEIGLLTSLTVLWLSFNTFNGILPTKIGLLTSLTDLYLG